MYADLDLCFISVYCILVIYRYVLALLGAEHVNKEKKIVALQTVQLLGIIYTYRSIKKEKYIKYLRPLWRIKYLVKIVVSSNTIVLSFLPDHSVKCNNLNQNN